METTPEHHVITSGGLRPLEARRVNAVSLKVARGPLRAISRHDSARSDIFFFFSLERRTSAEVAIARERISPSRFLFLSISRFPLFLRAPQFTVSNGSHRALLSLGEIECVISPLGITSASLWIPLRRRKKWKLLEYGERSSEMTTTMTTMSAIPKLVFEGTKKEDKVERRG